MNKAFAPGVALTLAAAAVTVGASAAQAEGFPSCDSVRAAGFHTPIPFGDPNYQPNLDRDNDGWACEPPGVTLPDPRKAHRPAPTTPASTKPAPSGTSHVTPAPVRPAKPAPSAPAQPGAGPKVDTDLVPAHESSAPELAALGLFAAAAGAAGWRLRGARTH